MADLQDTTITGAATVSSTLGVTGPTTVGSTLGVTGATTVGSTLGVTGATTVGSTLGVTGTTTMADATSTSLGVSGAATVGSTLGVTGATTMADATSTSLGVSGAATVGTTLGVSGTSTLGTTNMGAATCSTLDASGDITAYYSSDERLKKDIETITGALEKVKQIRGITYRKIDNLEGNQPSNITTTHPSGTFPGRDKYAGVIAQEVIEVLPEVVIKRPDEEGGMYAVEYDKMVSILIEAIKELDAKVEALSPTN